MRKILIILPLAALTACSGMANRYHIAMQCQADAGPKPYPAAEMFGLAGALIASGTPERQAWNARFGECLKSSGL